MAHLRQQYVALSLIGLGLLALFGALVAEFPLLHYFPGPGVTIGFDEIFGHNWVHGSLWYAGIFSAAFLLLAVAALLAPRRPTRGALALIFGFPVLFAATLIYMYPAMAMDVIHYYAEARTLWIYHMNSITVPVSAHLFIVGMSWPQSGSPYGPFWQILTGPSTLLAGDHWAWGVLGMKLIAAIAYLASAWLIYLTVRRLWPRRALFAVVLFAWNPFVAFRAVGNGHNDIVTVAFVLLAIYCVVSERWYWVFPALAAATMIKYVPIMLAPLFVISIVQLARERQNRRILIESGAGLIAATIISLALFAVFWDGSATFDSLRLATQPITSTPLVLATWLTGRVGSGHEMAIANLIVRLAFAGIYSAVLFSSRPRPERLISGCILIFFAYLVIATPWFRPWYFLWFVPLTVLQPSRWYVALGIIASFTVNFADLVEHYRVHLGWLQGHELGLIAAPVIVQFLLPCLVLVAALLLTRSPDLRAQAQDLPRGCPARA